MNLNTSLVEGNFEGKINGKLDPKFNKNFDMKGGIWRR